MDKVTGNKAVIASGASFKGQIKNTPSIEINGTVEADINADKLTIGEGGKFVGAANVELVVILCEVARSEASVARHNAVRTTRENE